MQKIKLIVGLGNIGREYTLTRHNIGFDFVDGLVNSRFIEEKKLKGLIADLTLGDRKIIIVKPTTMMNGSGESVQLVKSFYKINNDEILVVHDDLDILLGTFKIQMGKGPRIHNGVNSIENRLGDKNFWRLRVGIENRSIEDKNFMTGAGYVLGKFRNDEINTVKELFEKLNEQLFGSINVV